MKVGQTILNIALNLPIAFLHYVLYLCFISCTMLYCAFIGKVCPLQFLNPTSKAEGVKQYPQNRKVCLGAPKLIDLCKSWDIDGKHLRVLRV